MIVCHCEVVNDQQISHAINQGARTVAQVCGSTGAGKNCGSCIFTVKRLLCEHQDVLVDAALEPESAAG